MHQVLFQVVFFGLITNIHWGLPTVLLLTPNVVFLVLEMITLYVTPSTGVALGAPPRKKLETKNLNQKN